MDPNGMNVILNATPDQIRMLERKLTPGQAYPFPLALGGGLRLFAEGTEVKFDLAGTEAYDSGVVHLSYTAAS